MSVGPRELLRVQAHAFNARDLETVVGHYTAAARFVRDGQLIGEGQDAVRRGMVREMHDGAVVARLAELDGEPVLVEYQGDEGQETPRGVVRFQAFGDRLTECRVDHNPRVLERIAPRPRDAGIDG